MPGKSSKMDHFWSIWATFAKFGPLQYAVFIKIVENRKAQNRMKLYFALFLRFSCNFVANSLIYRKMLKKRLLISTKFGPLFAEDFPGTGAELPRFTRPPQ